MTSKAALITDANLPLEVVNVSKFDEFVSQRHTFIETGELKSSNGLLVSDLFLKCQGIAFLDRSMNLGALAHNFSLADPYKFLTGKMPYRTGDIIENLTKVFPDMSRVAAVHIYHESNHAYGKDVIEGALGQIGLKDVVHIPVKYADQNKPLWRDIALDVGSRSVYIFPRGFDFGIRYQIT